MQQYKQMKKKFTSSDIIFALVTALIIVIALSVVGLIIIAISLLLYKLWWVLMILLFVGCFCAIMRYNQS